MDRLIGPIEVIEPLPTEWYIKDQGHKGSWANLDYLQKLEKEHGPSPADCYSNLVSSLRKRLPRSLWSLAITPGGRNRVNQIFPAGRIEPKNFN